MVRFGNLKLDTDALQYGVNGGILRVYYERKRCHTLIAPYHPRSNGLVELFRSVQTSKQFFKAGDATQLSVARFFFSY